MPTLTPYRLQTQGHFSFIFKFQLENKGVKLSSKSLTLLYLLIHLHYKTNCEQTGT